LSAEGGTPIGPGRALPSSINDAELIGRCREGDQIAWRTLVERHASLVHGILRGAFRLESHDAEDAFQEVFTRLYVRLERIRDEDAVRGWIAQVTRNVALDWLRKSGRELASGHELDEHAFEEPLRAVDEALSVRDAMARLPEHQREILDRFFARDESYQTIGEELGIPPGTIASRISRALAALRVEFESEHPRR
jgi:RNA polymerase sigma factor (sigma-70 family)